MNPSLSENAQAILLLTAPLIVGRNEGGVDLLTLTEYNRLARILRENQLQPADLLGGNSKEVLSLVAGAFLESRLEGLLARGFLLSQAVERWTARSIWVVTRADGNYPKRIKLRLKEDAPPILYGCGDASLLETGGLAVVGSRDVTEELINYTEKVGRLAAEARRTIVSGGAKGIDRAAMHGALMGGGFVAGVMSDSLERAALARDNREPLMDRRLAFISPYDPAAGFNVGHAMQRNKVIYGLADAALVVTSDFEKGGTWSGAIEQLEKLRFVPVFVRNGANASKGNVALLKRGGQPWPDPRDAESLVEILAQPNAYVVSEPKQESLALFLREANADASSQREVNSDTGSVAAPAPEMGLSNPAERLLAGARPILLEMLAEYRTETALADLLKLAKPQVKAWLGLLLNEGVIEKKSNPVRYRVKSSEGRLL